MILWKICFIQSCKDYYRGYPSYKPLLIIQSSKKTEKICKITEECSQAPQDYNEPIGSAQIV